MIVKKYKNTGDKPLQYSVDPIVPFTVSINNNEYTFSFPQQVLATSTQLTLKNDCGQVKYNISIPAKCGTSIYSISLSSIGKGTIVFTLDNFQTGDIVLWSYPEGNYDVSETNNNISFYNIGAETEVIDLEAIVNTEAGCQFTETLLYNLPKTVAENATAYATCGEHIYEGKTFSKKYEFKLVATPPNQDVAVSWNTFVLEAPEEAAFVRNGTNLTVYLPNVKRSYQIDWYVSDNRGFASTVGTLNLVSSGLCPDVTIPGPDFGDPESSLAREINMPSGETERVIPIQEIIPDSDIVDLTFVPYDTQTVTGGVLTTFNGEAEFTQQGDIRYTRSGIVVPVDIVRLQGERDGRLTRYYDTYVKDPLFTDYTPAAPAFMATLADSTPTSNVMVANWQYLEPSTFKITTPPTKGTVVLDVNTGLLTYEALIIGSDSFAFTIQDIYGNVLGPITATSTYTSPGTGRTTSLPTGTVVNLADYLIGPASTGGTYTVKINGGASNPVATPASYTITSPIVNTTYIGTGGKVVVFPAKHEATYTVGAESTVIEINSIGEQLYVDVFEIDYGGTPDLLRIEGTDPDVAAIENININVDDGVIDTDYTVSSFSNDRFIREIQLAAGKAYAITISTTTPTGYVKSIVLGLNT